MKKSEKKDTATPTLIHNLQRLAHEFKEWKKSLESYEEPYCEISQNQKGVHINIKLPHVKKKSISLRMNSSKMEVKGENSKTNYYRIVDIPSIVDITRARAVFNNGMLKVNLPYTRAL